MTLQIGKADAKRVGKFLDTCRIKYNTTELKKGVEMQIRCRRKDESFIQNWLNVGTKEVRDYIWTAQDLGYPHECVLRILHSTSELEIIRQLTTFRQAG